MAIAPKLDKAVLIVAANKDKSYDEVCKLIAPAIDVTYERATEFYRHIVIKHLVLSDTNEELPRVWLKRPAKPTPQDPAVVQAMADYLTTGE